jgi:hypothetical protein
MLELKDKKAALTGAALLALAPYAHADMPYATIGRLETGSDVTVSIFYRDLPDTTWMRKGENITGIMVEEPGKEPYFIEGPAANTQKMRERAREVEDASIDLGHSISYKGIITEKKGKVETARSFVRCFPTFEEFVAAFEKR